MDFHTLIEKLSKLPRARRYGLILLAYVAFMAIFWGMFYSPTAGKLASLDAETTTLDSKRQQVRIRAADREKFEEELQRLTDDLRTALRELPNDREIPDLLKRISLVGKKVGLEVRKFQPLPEKMQEYYAEVPVALEVVGTFHEVAMFFDRLSKLGRIVSVRGVNIGEPEERGGRVELNVTGRAVTYRFLSQEEIDAKNAAAQPRGRRGRKGRK
ncbi:MAG: type 4a pilus biogenesis protein PilO [Myxococcota bacterium]|nr:type 4a pilus biogenesis protein PilO [Myxococcota bacterium]